MIPATCKEIVSAFKVAKVFGVISPKIKINKVIMPVATPAPVFPSKSIARTVAMEEVEIFTILLPIRIAPSIFPEFSITFPSVTAFLLPSSIRVRTRIRFTVVKAVSAQEKKADKKIRTNSTIKRMATLGSKKNHSL